MPHMAVQEPSRPTGGATGRAQHLDAALSPPGLVASLPLR
jgi:hypothetical protein